MIDQSIYNTLINNHIDYDKLKNNFCKYKIFDKGHYDINVIIPIKGRINFANPIYQSFKKAREKSNLKISYTVVEVSTQNEHESFCIENNINYVWIETMPGILFNKCLALNVGALFTVSSDAFIFHDIDCLMQSDFFIKLEENIKNKNAKAIQCFQGRRLLYLNDILTEKVINNELEIDDFNITYPGISLPEHIGAPGGSIYTTKDLFFKVGGWDPELFQGHAPEDIFYWEKISILDTMYICDNPPIELYHMSHPVTYGTNPNIVEMKYTFERFIKDSYENKLELILYKKNLINGYNI
jgi:predicted glycosyltransferase involved in capsule biosynthesis